MGIVVAKRQGHVIPDAYLQKVIDTEPSCFGNAIRYMDSGGAALFTAVTKGKPTLAMVKEVQDNFKNDLIFFFFGDYQDGFNDEDMQPFVLLDDGKDNPILCAFLVGAYPMFERTGSSHPAEFHAAMEYLRPKVMKIYNDNGQDLTKTMKALDDPLFKADLSLMYMGNSKPSIILYAETAEFVVSPATQAAFNWGWTNNALGHEEKDAPQEQLKTEPEKPRNPMMPGARGKPATVVNAPATVTAEDKKPDPKDTAAQITTAEQSLPLNAYYKAPDDLKKAEKIARAYKENAGYCPPNYKDKPRVRKSDAMLQKLGIDLKSFASLDKIVQIANGQTQENREKDVTTKNIPQPEPEPMITTNHITSDMIKKFNAGLKTKVMMSFDEKARVVPDPKYIQALEENSPSFTQKFGLPGIEVFFQAPDEKIRACINDLSKLELECLFKQMIIEMMKAEQVIHGLETAASKMDQTGTGVVATQKVAAAGGAKNPLMPGARR